MEAIIKDIQEEIKRSESKYPNCNHNLERWCNILNQEVGEAAKEALKFSCNGVYYNINTNEVLSDYREELIQVAATAIRAIQSLERNELESC